MLSLTGDSADNIPGVPGLGVKGASALLREHGSLDVLLREPERIRSERIREKIVASREQVEQNREMVRLDLDLDLPVALEELVVSPRHGELIRELELLEFRSLVREVSMEAGTTGGISDVGALRGLGRPPEGGRDGGGVRGNTMGEAVQGELF